MSSKKLEDCSKTVSSIYMQNSALSDTGISQFWLVIYSPKQPSYRLIIDQIYQIIKMLTGIDLIY